MKNLDEQLTRLGTTARSASAPSVDVRARVRQTISAHDAATAKVDLVPVSVGGVLVTLAASTCAVLFPYWQIMLNPWASYFAR